MADNKTNDALSSVLWCLVEGDSTAFKVAVTSNAVDIADLKKLVHKEKDRGVLRDVNAADLVLWKVMGSVPVDPDDTLVERLVGLLGADSDDLSKLAIRLSSAMKIPICFPWNMPKDDLHIIAQVLHDHERSQRQYISSEHQDLEDMAHPEEAAKIKFVEQPEQVMKEHIEVQERSDASGGDEDEGQAPPEPMNGTKRKVAEDSSGLRPVEGKCDRCASFVKPAGCELRPHDLRCKRCRDAKQACYWEGVTRSGARRKRDVPQKMSGNHLSAVKPKKVSVQFIGVPPPSASSSNSTLDGPSQDKGKVRAVEADIATTGPEVEGLVEELGRVKCRMMALQCSADALERRLHELA